mmetsp:Transcript_13782/g.44942  ORF Transcript_13782/g.44942 Transcript_13782/m.44942 type:complete len:344 (-) Transcript_13782:121-1152(-)
MDVGRDVELRGRRVLLRHSEVVLGVRLENVAPVVVGVLGETLLVLADVANDVLLDALPADVAPALDVLAGLAVGAAEAEDPRRREAKVAPLGPQFLGVLEGLAPLVQLAQRKERRLGPRKAGGLLGALIEGPESAVVRRHALARLRSQRRRPVAEEARIAHGVFVAAVQLGPRGRPADFRQPSRVRRVPRLGRRRRDEGPVAHRLQVSHGLPRADHRPRHRRVRAGRRAHRIEVRPRARVLRLGAPRRLVVRRTLGHEHPVVVVVRARLTNRAAPVVVPQGALVVVLIRIKPRTHGARRAQLGGRPWFRLSAGAPHHGKGAGAHHHHQDPGRPDDHPTPSSCS